MIERRNLLGKMFVIRNEKVFLQKFNYIHYNPIKYQDAHFINDEMMKINLIDTSFLPIVLFLILSVIVYKKIVKSNFVMSFLASALYLILSYIILFPFADWFDSLIRRRGIQIVYSHNDMVLFTEIIIGCALIAILTLIAALLKKIK